MAKVTVAEVDKKVAVIEQQLVDHVKSCEQLAEETLERVKRLEYFIIATLLSVVGGTVLVVVQLITRSLN
jgi:hypothetical protein|tara:strand:- start:197 stop:406 length:210 start_codon:yes stop_codon:yes gene_type:complete